MRMTLKKQTTLLIWIPLLLSLIIIGSGIFGVNIVDGKSKIDTISFVGMIISYVFIIAFTVLGDIKRPDVQWNSKPLYYIFVGSILLFSLVLVSKNIELFFTLLLVFGVVYFFTLIIYMVFRSKLIISEAQRQKNRKFVGELPYEYTSRKIYLFSKFSGGFIILVAVLGIIFMYANGNNLSNTLPFAIFTIFAYLLSKVFIVQYEKGVEKRITQDFYYKLNGTETIEYIDKILKEKLHKDKVYDLKLMKVEILEYIGEHETARKIFRSLGKPNEYNEFTYEFLSLDYLDKTDVESYLKALKRIERKIPSIKKEKYAQRITSLLEEYTLEIYIRFNKKIDERKLSYFSNAKYQLTRIKNNYILGRYYFNIKDYDEAKSRLEYVIKYGGELKKYTHAAQKILDKIENGK